MMDITNPQALKDRYCYWVEIYLIRAIVLIFFLLALSINFSVKSEQQFSYLAKSFLKGRNYFLEIPGTTEDTILFNGKYYWPLAPFPAIVLMPFVFIFQKIGLFFYQGYLQIFFTLAIFFMCFKLSQRCKYSKHDSIFLAFAFCFSSIYQLVAIIPWSWYFVQSLCVFISLLAIWEYFNKKRYWLIGILCSFLFMSRFTAGFLILFFIIKILFNSNYDTKFKLKYLLMLAIPTLFVGVFLLHYNYSRFGNVFENGYRLANSRTMSENERYELINYGLFKPKNIPTNLYYYFIKTLDPVLVSKETLHGNTYILKPPYVRVAYPGTSFFIVSPVFIYIFNKRIRWKLYNAEIITIVAILLLLLTYYWTGWRQVGPRYLLDLLPLAFLLLLQSFGKHCLTKITKLVILTSAFLNLYLLCSIF